MMEAEDDLDDGEQPDPETDGDLADDGEADTRPCPGCGSEIFEDADRCPSCGEYVTPGGGKNRSWTFWTAALLLALMLLAFFRFLKLF